MCQLIAALSHSLEGSWNVAVRVSSLSTSDNTRSGFWSHFPVSGHLVLTASTTSWRLWFCFMSFVCVSVCVSSKLLKADWIGLINHHNQTSAYLLVKNFASPYLGWCWLPFTYYSALWPKHPGCRIKTNKQKNSLLCISNPVAILLAGDWPHLTQCTSEVLL